MIRGAIIVRVEDGKIIEGWEYLDSANAAAQLA
jgi:ketosteroid isomerase-like protein